MFSSRFWAQAVAFAFVLAQTANAVAEQHTITFVNDCGNGSYPELVFDGKNILTGDSYTSNGAWSGISYLQTGQCGANGEECSLVEITLHNPQCAGCGSCADISLISPHYFNVLTSFAFYNGCDGVGKECDSENCGDNAFFTSTDYAAQAYCETDNVDLLIAFCANASELVLSNQITGGSSSTSSPSTSPSLLPTTPGTPSSGAPSGTPSSSPSLPGSVIPGTSTNPSTPPSSGTPSSSPSLPGSVIPGTSTNGVPSPTDTGCWDTDYTMPTSTSTPTPTNVSVPGTLPTNPPSTPPSSPSPSTPTPTSTPTETPTPTSTRKKCKPRPTTLAPSSSAPTSPAVSQTPSVNPSSTPSPSTPAVQRRRHRRAHDRHM